MLLNNWVVALSFLFVRTLITQYSEATNYRMTTSFHFKAWMNWFSCCCTLTDVSCLHLLRVHLHKIQSDSRVDTQRTNLSTMLLWSMKIRKSENLWFWNKNRTNAFWLDNNCDEFIYFSKEKTGRSRREYCVCYSVQAEATKKGR